MYENHVLIFLCFFLVICQCGETHDYLQNEISFVAVVHTVKRAMAAPAGEPLA